MKALEEGFETMIGEFSNLEPEERHAGFAVYLSGVSTALILVEEAKGPDDVKAIYDEAARLIQRVARGPTHES